MNRGCAGVAGVPFIAAHSVIQEEIDVLAADGVHVHRYSELYL